MKLRLIIPCVLTIGLAHAARGEPEDDAETQIKFTDAPAAVQNSLTREAHGVAIETVSVEKEDGVTEYEAVVTIDGKQWEIEVDETGLLLEKSLVELEQLDEHEVELKDLPPAVRRTLEAESVGAKIEEIEFESINGIKIFEAEISADQHQWEVTIREDGQLLKKELEDDHDDDRDNDREDDEHDDD